MLIPLAITTRYIIYDLLSVDLFDVEYYRHLEIMVTDHSRSLELVPFESLSAVFYSLSTV